MRCYKSGSCLPITVNKGKYNNRKKPYDFEFVVDENGFGFASPEDSVDTIRSIWKPDSIVDGCIKISHLSGREGNYFGQPDYTCFWVIKI